MNQWTCFNLSENNDEDLQSNTDVVGLKNSK